MVSDNYFRSVSGLPPAPYLDQPPTQLALEQNNSDHLTKLARLEVESILRTLEQPGMYVDGNHVKSVTPCGTCQEWIATRYTQQTDNHIHPHGFERRL